MAILAATTAIISPVCASAQIVSGDATATPQAASVEEPPEIIVTALKRSLSVQDTPASIQIIGGDALQTSAINTIQQIGALAPGVSVTRPPNNSASAKIRGLGTSPGPVSFDQGVALFVDGIYAARGADFLSSLFDLDHIEVVKGSQAAVLGKNTSLGALVLTTRKPGHEFAIDALASYEFERDSKVISGGIDIPMGDFAVRAAGQFQDLGGIQTNRFTGAGAERESLQTRQAAGRITAVYDPGSQLKITASYSHENLRNLGTQGEFVQGSPAALALFNASGFGALYETDFDNRYARFSLGGPTVLRQSSDRVATTIEYDLGSAAVTSITGWSRFRQRRHIDYDLTPGTYFTDDALIKGRQFSQELRLASDGASNFNYLVGGVYVHNTLRQQDAQATAYPTGLTGAFDSLFAQKSETYSGFGQLSYRLLPNFSLTGGLRVTNESKDVDMQREITQPGPFSAVVFPPYALTRLGRSETVVDGSVTAEFHPSEDILLYASYGQGTKGGGFTDTAVPANAEYRKEVARTAEIGLKIEGQDRDWHFNIAGFRTKVRDFQNNFFNGVTFVVQNLDISSVGAELDGFWQLAPGLRFDVQATYAHTKNEDAPPAQSDKRLPQSPRLAGKAGLTYEKTVSNGWNWHLSGDVSYRSRVSHQLDPASVPFGDAYTTLNAAIGVGNENQGWDVSLIGRNLNDARSLSFAFPAPFIPGAVIGAPEETRTVTLQLRLNF